LWRCGCNVRCATELSGWVVSPTNKTMLSGPLSRSTPGDRCFCRRKVANHTFKTSRMSLSPYAGLSKYVFLVHFLVEAARSKN
jgi:hypothetical protein